MLFNDEDYLHQHSIFCNFSFIYNDILFTNPGSFNIVDAFGGLGDSFLIASSKLVLEVDLISVTLATDTLNFP